MLLSVLGVFSCLVTLSQSLNDSSFEDDEGLIWGWVSMMMSRSGIYITLVAVLLMNVLITALRNKKDSSQSIAASVEIDRKQWPPNLTSWERTQEITLGNPFPTDNSDTFRERLREAEAAVSALKIELEQTLRCKISLENSVEELERDRSYSEDELVKLKMEGALELENLRKDNSSMTRQLERARNEVTELKVQVEVLQREPRISESALKDQQSLTEQLDATRTELEAIKAQLRGVTLERDMAVHLTSSQLVKIDTDALVDSTEIERPRMRRSEAQENIKEWTVCQTIGETDNSVTLEINGKAVGDAQAVCSCRNDTIDLVGVPSMCSNLERTVSISEDYSDDDPDHEHMVTGSPAFLAFLRSNYGR